jgi:heme iron utilization protein
MLRSDAHECRSLVSCAKTGSLATLTQGPPSYPFASLVALAEDPSGCPIFLLSALAEHTKNLMRDPRASVLVVDAESTGDPLAGRRVTLVGDVALVSEDQAALRALFLARHRSASTYANFSDFDLYRLVPHTVRYVGGFGKMSFVDVADYANAWT